MKKKYIILSASYWNWHNSAANSIKNHIKKLGDDVLIIDFIEFIGNKWNISKKYYKFSSEKYPFLWYFTFKILNKKLINFFLKKFILNFSNKFDKIINNFKPDIIIWVYPLWQNLIWGYLKNNKKTFKFWVFITDSMISLPWYFDNKFIDKFFTIDKYTENKLKEKLKNREADIKTTFFPIEEKFFLNKEKLKNKDIAILLSWLDEKFTSNFLKKLDKDNFYNEILVIKGRNEKLFQKLKIFKNKKIKFFNYLNIKEKLKNIDIFVSKAWWALVSECIASDVFMIIPSFLPWQEKWNIELIKKNNLWICSNNTNKIINFLKKDYLNIDLNNFKKIKNKKAIENILNLLY